MIDKMFILYSALCGILDILVVKMLILHAKYKSIHTAFSGTDWVYFVTIHAFWIAAAILKYEII